MSTTPKTTFASLFRTLSAPFFILAAWGVIVASLLAYLAAYVSPAWVGWLPFFGVFYPVWLFGQLVLLPWALRYKKRLFIYLLVVFVGGCGHLNGIFAYKRHAANPKLTKHSFTLMSYNTHGDLWLSLHKNAERTANCLELLRRNRPNILLLQEEVKHEANSENSPILQSYAYQIKEPYIDVSIYTDFPILHSQYFAKTDRHANNLAMYADIQLDKYRVVRVFNVHLKSIGLGKDADNFVKNVEDLDDENGQQAYFRTFRKMHRAWQIRTVQANEIADSIANSPYPVIVAGDFNDTPSSYAYHTIGAGLQDAFKVGGRGFSFSYNGNLPALSIDHIFVSSQYPIYGFRVVREGGSDHYPVRVEVGY